MGLTGLRGQQSMEAIVLGNGIIRDDEIELRLSERLLVARSVRGDCDLTIEMFFVQQISEKFHILGVVFQVENLDQRAHGRARNSSGPSTCSGIGHPAGYLGQAPI